MTTTIPRSPFTTAAFWAGLAERSISTFAGALLAALGADAAGLLAVDWAGALSVAALATVVSILKAIAAPQFTAGQPAEVDATPVPTDYQPRYRAEAVTTDPHNTTP